MKLQTVHYKYVAVASFKEKDRLKVVYWLTENVL